MKIAIDIDDCIAEYVEGLTQFYNKIHDEKVSINDIKAWDLKTAFEKTSTPESIKALMDLFIHSEYLREAQEVPGAVPTIQKLIEEGHELYFISARGSRAIDSAYKWFYAHNLPLKNIYFNRDKAWLVDKLGIDVMVDDGVHNLDAIVAACGKRCSTIIYDRPWNRTAETRYAHYRAADWKQIKKIIEECV